MEGAESPTASVRVKRSYLQVLESDKRSRRLLPLSLGIQRAFRVRQGRWQVVGIKRRDSEDAPLSSLLRLGCPASPLWRSVSVTFAPLRKCPDLSFVCSWLEYVVNGSVIFSEPKLRLFQLRISMQMFYLYCITVQRYSQSLSCNITHTVCITSN